MNKNIESNYRKFPKTQVEGEITNGWPAIVEKLGHQLIAIDTYTGVNVGEIEEALGGSFRIIHTTDLYKPVEEVEALTEQFMTDNAIFGHVTSLSLRNFFDSAKLEAASRQLNGSDEKVAVVGPGAFIVAPEAAIKVYADMPRWEIQLRMKKGEVNGLGVKNNQEPFNLQYKRGYFIDWIICDKHKKQWFSECDFLLDSTIAGQPKLVEMGLLRTALNKVAHQPFSFVPYFNPGPWGGHWLEKVCDLETEGVPNYAWCMNCVAEENSLLIEFENGVIEIPGNDLVFIESRNLLGDAVEGRFGKEFPIRFDFLDTMGGGNLSLQVHPDIDYIQETFGMHYTQDESYYLIDAEDDAVVYLGLKENADLDDMFKKLRSAHANGTSFEAEEFVNVLPARKHDHFLIPSGTIHCSGKNSLVLEISSTPSHFTFKMWDWGRLDLDGKPRPINLEHAYHVIDESRDTGYVNRELVNNVEVVSSGSGWVEERTGLHQREFIETRRHFFSEKVLHESNGTVNVLMLVEGSQAIIESPDDAFEPFVINFAEAIVIPASISSYTITPYGNSKGQKLATLKAYVRF